MYQDFFDFTELPFAIVPNPKFFFLSERHKEALSHMLSGISGGGGMALLTGEVGTGKTMTMRALLARLPTQSQVLTIVNPSLSELELLQTICDGFEIGYKPEDSFKLLLDLITEKLYRNEDESIDNILLIDEAQHLKPQALELLRLLTNIETVSHKLLKVILIGQPELHQVLSRDNLRQLAQRITERYQLMPLPEDELKQYIQHRLACAGRLAPLFNEACYRIFANYTDGVPRLINLVCDQSLKLAYREGKRYISADIARQACRHVLEWQMEKKTSTKQLANYKPYYIGTVVVAGVIAFSSLSILLARSVINPTEISKTELAEVKPIVVEQPKETVQSEVIVQPEVIEERLISEQLAAKTDIEIEEAPAPIIKTISFSRMVSQGISMGRAVQDLYQQWGYEADEDASICRIETRADLSCYRGTMQLNQIANINRPAILVMNAKDGKLWYALLYGIGEEQIELIVGRDKQRFIVSKAFVEKHWSGETILLWRPPLGNSNMLSMGQRNARVRWLNDRLNMALGEFDEGKNHFDQYIRNKVIAFQLQQHIDADGIAGPLTIMTLDGVLGLAGPTLKQSVTLSEAEKSLIDDDAIVLLEESEDLEDIQIALRPLPPYVASKITKPIKKVALNTKSTQQHNVRKKETPKVNTSAATEFSLGSEVVDISELDFSSLSPTLAKKVENALIQVAKTPKSADQSAPLNQSYSNVVDIEDLPPTILNRLPEMDFQAHVYASNPEDRWIKVNNRNILEGQNIAGKVLLRGVEPNQVVVQFEGKLIAIPALSTW